MAPRSVMGNINFTSTVSLFPNKRLDFDKKGRGPLQKQHFIKAIYNNVIHSTQAFIDNFLNSFFIVVNLRYKSTSIMQTTASV